MRIAAKIFTLLIIFTLLLLIAGAGFLQTDYAQKKICRLIEKKMDGKITIGHLKAFIPFWISLKDVHYSTAKFDASFDEVEISLLPTLLLVGKLAITDLKIGHAYLESNHLKDWYHHPHPSTCLNEYVWPLPFSIDLYRFKINSFTAGELRDISISGTGSAPHFYLRLQIIDPKRPDVLTKLILHGNDQEQKLYPNNLKNWNFGKASAQSVSQQRDGEGAELQQIGQCGPDCNLGCPVQPKTNSSGCLGINLLAEITDRSHKIDVIINGFYDWQSKVFEGKMRGTGNGWQSEIEGRFENNNLLILSTLQAQIDDYKIQAELNYDLQTHCLHGAGTFLEHPFTLQTHLFFTKEKITASQLYLDYNHEFFYGDLSYLFLEKKVIGEIDVEIHDLAKASQIVSRTSSPLSPSPQHRLEGCVRAHLSLTKDLIFFNLQAGQVTWKDLFVPQLTMEGSWQQGMLSFAVDLPDFTIYDSAYEVFPKVQFQLSGQLCKESLMAQGYIWGMGEQPFYLRCSLPMRCSLMAHDITINREAPFLVHVQGCGSIDPILAFLENASLVAHGKIDLDLTATGTWNEPHLEGHLIYDAGRIESLTTGAIFRDIHMEMEGIGKKLKVRSLSAYDLQKGELMGRGEIIWDPQSHFPFHFEINTNHYMILALDPFTASVNAEILLSGTIKEMMIAGHAQLDEGHLAIPTKIPLQVPTVDVSYINPIATHVIEYTREKPLIPIHWDITIEAPHHLFIDGRGLESEWRGNLKISGEQHGLNYQGKLYLVQGRFKIINRMFGLVEGEVRIDGLKPKDLFVNLRGDYELPNLTASVLIAGSLDDTNIAFCSNPPMNMNQILSWILFQQDMNELTPMQACSLASILVSMSSKYTGPKTFDNIKEGLGIDVFSITDCDIDSADVTFQVGKYLSQGTFVGINKSISGNFDSVLIQTRLIRNFYLEADYGGSLNGVTPSGGKVILKWYKSY